MILLCRILSYSKVLILNIFPDFSALTQIFLNFKNFFYVFFHFRLEVNHLFLKFDILN